MADQGRWFKLWVTAADDPDLSNLSLEDFARWCLFGLYMKSHGDDGSIALTAPSRALCERLRLPSFRALVDALRRFPNCILSTGPITWPHGIDKAPSIRGDVVSTGGVRGVELLVSNKGGQGVSVTMVSVTADLKCIHVCWRNWRKYQRDSSVERTKKWRAKGRGEGDAGSDGHVTTLEERRGEEKRREEKKQKKEGKPREEADADFLAALRTNPAYQGIDIDRELGKLDAWLLTPKGRGKKKTRARIVYWLNGVDQPVGSNGQHPTRNVNDAWKGRTGGEVKI